MHEPFAKGQNIDIRLGASRHAVDAPMFSLSLGSLLGVSGEAVYTPSIVTSLSRHSSVFSGGSIFLAFV
jgi:hypothetical protein